MRTAREGKEMGSFMAKEVVEIPEIGASLETPVSPARGMPPAPPGPRYARSSPSW